MKIYIGLGSVFFPSPPPLPTRIKSNMILSLKSCLVDLKNCPNDSEYSYRFWIIPSIIRPSKKNHRGPDLYNLEKNLTRQKFAKGKGLA